MTPIDVLAKVVGKELHHNEPDRPFTDEAWERELRWWRKAKEEAAEGTIDISYTMYADKCYRIARAALLALAECNFEDSILKKSMERYYQGPENDEVAAFGGGVKELLRSIANGGDNDVSG